MQWSDAGFFASQNRKMSMNFWLKNKISLSSNHPRMGILVQSLLGFHHAFFDTSTYTMETIKRQKKYIWVIFNTTKSTKQPKRFSEGQTKACLDMSYYNHIFKTIHLFNLQQKYSQGQRTSSVNSFATIVNG